VPALAGKFFPTKVGTTNKQKCRTTVFQISQIRWNSGNTKTDIDTTGNNFFRRNRRRHRGENKYFI